MISLSDYMRNTEYSTRDAIEDAISSGHSVNKHADPTEGARVGLTADEAMAVAKEDPSLIYIVYLGAQG